MDLVGEVSILSTIHGTVHILMVCILHGDMAMVGFTHLTIMGACILLGDTEDGTHLSTVVGAIHGIMVGMVVITAEDTGTDMEVVFTTDTILDSPIIDQVEAQVLTDHQQVEDQVWLAVQDVQVVQPEAV